MRRGVSIESRFRSYLSNERIRGLWETETGLAVIQRQLIKSGSWESPAPEPIGLYHIAIHKLDSQVIASYNGRVRHAGFFPANTIHFVPPDADVHSTGYGSLKFLEVSFTPAFLARHLASLSINPDVVELRDLPSTDDIGLSRLAQTYEAISANGISVTQLYFDTIREAMFERIVRRHASRTIRPAPEVLVPAKVRRVIDYIEANLACDLQLVELSAVAGISRWHFARAFRHTVGMAPHTFVLQRRLARAIDWLTPPTLSMEEVAARCGFADHAHFTRAFKSQFGHPPSRHVPHRRSKRGFES
jgi:AraC-like DNA-binding protein